MRISDWSSDVCSSDLVADVRAVRGFLRGDRAVMAERGVGRVALVAEVVQAGRETGRLLLRIRRRSGADPAGVCLARAPGSAPLRPGHRCIRTAPPTLIPPGFSPIYARHRRAPAPLPAPPDPRELPQESNT